MIKYIKLLYIICLFLNSAIALSDTCNSNDLSCIDSSKHEKENSNEEGEFLLYTNIKVANRSESLLKIKNIPIVFYQFKYDTVQDRYQMGIIGPDAQKYFPESIDVIPSKTFSNKDRSKPSVILTNFPVIDKNVLYMHGLVALQELVYKYEELTHLIDSIEESGNRLKEELNSILNQIERDVDAHTLEQLNIIKLEEIVSLKQLELEASKKEEDRLVIERQLMEEKVMMEYESELARERMLRQEELSKANNLQMIQLEKELAEKKDLMKRNSAELLSKKRQEQAEELELKKLQYEKEKIKAELDAKASQILADQQIQLQKIQAQSKLDTDRMITGIKTISNQISRIATEIFSKPKQVAIFVAIILSLFALYYLMKEISNIIRQYIKSRIGKPSLVRETSYTLSILPHFILDLFSKTEELATGRKILEEKFKDIILSSEDKQRVINLALATRNTRQSGAPYRHVLLHGPPGTGKTLIARNLARCSGMDYAIMSGGDVAPLGEDAVNQLHGLFHWATKSRKGLLVFIDEAEAFLATRTGSSNGTGVMNNDENSMVHIRNALNALLYQTGTPSHSFMLVLATNRPEDLDVAVLDRMDVSISISPPALPQRIDLTKLYMKLYLKEVADQSQSFKWFSFFSSNKRFLDDTCQADDTINYIAQITNGFSGREIAKLFIASQYVMYLANNSTLTKDLLLQTVHSKVEEHNIKFNGFIKEKKKNSNIKNNINQSNDIVDEILSPANKNKPLRSNKSKMK